MKILMPYFGEFGGELIVTVPRAYTIDEPYIACHNSGKNCLYPNAKMHMIFDDQKIFNDYFEKHQENEYLSPIRLKSRKEWFIPKETNKYDFEADIVLFARKKKNMAVMNWDKWPILIEMLKAEGINVFIAGHPDYSYHLNCHSAWDYNNSLEASIHALKHSKLRIGLITALHVLSMMCGAKPIVLITLNGMKHPRANIKPNLNYLKTADHLKVGYECWPYLENMEMIIQEIINCLKGVTCIQ